MQCVSCCPLQKKKTAQHTDLFACDGVHQCIILYGVWWVSVSVCFGVCREKKGRGKHTVKQKQKGLFPKPLFPFSLFPPLFHPLFFPCLPLFHIHSLLIHTHLFFMLHTCVHSWRTKNTNDSTSDSFHRLFFCPNSLSLFFSFI